MSSSTRRRQQKKQRQIILGGVVLTAILATFLFVMLPGIVANRTPVPVSDKVADYYANPPTAAPDPLIFVAIGDSYTGGSPMGGSRGTPTNWVLHTTSTIRDKGTNVVSFENGIGGSGYVNRGPEGDTFGERAAVKLNEDTDVVVFFGSINDQRQPLNEIIVAADRAWAEAQKLAPNAQFIAVGPAWMRAEVPDEINAITESLKILAVKHGFDFVDPDAERWFLDNPELIGTDGTHPTDEGHVLMSSKLEPHVSAALDRL